MKKLKERTANCINMSIKLVFICGYILNVFPHLTKMIRRHSITCRLPA
jgi:hypothetical protein